KKCNIIHPLFIIITIIIIINIIKGAPLIVAGGPPFFLLLLMFFTLWTFGGPPVALTSTTVSPSAAVPGGPLVRGDAEDTPQGSYAVFADADGDLEPPRCRGLPRGPSRVGGPPGAPGASQRAPEEESSNGGPSRVVMSSTLVL